MKKTNLLACLLTLALTLTSTIQAGSTSFKDKVILEETTCLFRANEIQLDLFSTTNFSKNQNMAWGGGIGVNYFLTNFVGIGVEQDLSGRRGQNAEWTTAGHLFLRYPICSLNLAPYLLVGGGTSYGSNRTAHGFGDVGLGLEYRVTRNIGLFTDARFVYSSAFPETGVTTRAGLRFAF